MATGSNDTTIKIYCLETNQCIKTLLGHRGILKLKFFYKNLYFISPNQSILKISTWIFFIKILNKISLSGMVRCLEQLKSNGNLISGSYDQTIKMLNVEREESKTLECQSAVLCLKQLTSNKIACGCIDSSIKIWNYSCKSGSQKSKNLF